MAGVPVWVLAVVPLALIATAIAAFALLGGPGLDERNGPPVEELAVERTVLRPGEIELTLRNTGPDPVSVAQVAVADSFVTFTEEPDGEVGTARDPDGDARLPVAGGLPVRDLHAHLDGGHDRPRDRRRGRDARDGRRASTA